MIVKYKKKLSFILSSAFPVSGMVTIPVSMYQTVVTNIQNLSEATAMPITMTTVSASSTSATESNTTTITATTEDQVNDASTTTTVEMSEDVKTVLNGTQTSMVTTEDES